MDEDTGTKGGGVRSVAWPFISLAEAVDRAKVFYERERRNSAPVSSAVDHWGYSAKSSGGRQTIAALLQFGLLEDEGTGDARSVKLTERALDIVLDDDGLFRRKSALRDAAQSPKLYQEILTRYPAAALPSDATLRHYLLREKSLNPNAVEACISKFRETVSFAGLDRQDGSTPPNIEPAGVPAAQPDASQGPVARSPTTPVQTVSSALTTPGDYREEIFSTDEGPVLLRWPSKLTADTVADVKDWLLIVQRKLDRSARLDKAPGTVDAQS